MSSETIGVVGAGTMGTGVAQLFAEAGFPVALVDIEPGALTRARAHIAQALRLAPLLRPGTPAVPESAIDAITFTTDFDALSDAAFVVENVTEEWPVKERVHRLLDQTCPQDCVFGVNTSAIQITRVGAATRRPDRVIGTHFMNPAPMKPLVEVIRGHLTSDATVKLTRELLDRAGKDSIVVSDSPGFVTNRVAMLTVNEAVFLLQEGVSSAEDIDRLFKECFGHPMGPLETADLIGLDTVLASLEVLHESFGDPKYRPCTLLKELVYAGRLGRKSGQGFHTYESLPTH